jgi:hypothetical protein
VTLGGRLEVLQLLFCSNPAADEKNVAAMVATLDGIRV